MQWHQWNPFCAKVLSGVARPVRMYICVLFFFYVDHVCEHVMCWATPLYCEQCVFKIQTLLVFMEALKPFVGLFHKRFNSQLCSDPGNLTQRVLCVIEFLCRCGVCKSPGTTTGERSHLWMCLGSNQMETMATWQIYTELLLTFSHSWSWIKLSFYRAAWV